MKKCQTNERRRRRARTLAWLSLLIFLMAAETVLAGDTREKIFAGRAEAAFYQAQIQFQSRTNDPVAAWKFGRACYDWADWATNKAQRAAIAKNGIAACRRSLLFKDSAAAHYYLALNLGQLARSEMLGALKLVHEMDREFKAAADSDAPFDYAGPLRCLGLLYRDAPGWPMSIGNRQKARKFLKSAATVAPAYPENILNLAETDLKWGDHADAKKELETLDTLWPRAQKNLAGEAWEQSWDDWSQRRDLLRQKLNQS